MYVSVHFASARNLLRSLNIEHWHEMNMRTRLGPCELLFPCRILPSSCSMWVLTGGGSVGCWDHMRIMGNIRITGNRSAHDSLWPGHQLFCFVFLMAGDLTGVLIFGSDRKKKIVSNI